MHPGPFLEPMFVCKKAVLLLPACSTPFSSPFSFSFSFSLYPLGSVVDVSVLRGFCDLWVVLSSICYFFVPRGTPHPFSEHCGRAGEVGTVVPSACLQTRSDITDSTSLSLGTRNLRISAVAPASTTPSTQADTLLQVLGMGRLSLLELKAAGSGSHCGQGLPGTETSQPGGQPCLQA